jgi:hypothetical protein
MNMSQQQKYKCTKWNKVWSHWSDRIGLQVMGRCSSHFSTHIQDVTMFNTQKFSRIIYVLFYMIYTSCSMLYACCSVSMTGLWSDPKKPSWSLPLPAVRERETYWWVTERQGIEGHATWMFVMCMYVLCMYALCMYVSCTPCVRDSPSITVDTTRGRIDRDTSA